MRELQTWARGGDDPCQVHAHGHLGQICGAARGYNDMGMDIK